MEGVKTRAAQRKEVGIHPAQDLDYTEADLRMLDEDERGPELQGAKARFPEPKDIAGGDRVHIGDWAQQEMRELMGGMIRDFSAVMREEMRALVQERGRNERIQSQTTSPIQPPRSTVRATHISNGVESDSSQDEDTRSEATSTLFQQNRRSQQSSGSARLPPFTGKDSWQVWFNRFLDLAKLKRWSDQHKLAELIPRLQGSAGDFVYGQLPEAVRSNYALLIRELESRYRVVETKRTYRAQFSNRSQQNGETVEDFASDLKRLYDKAHSDRDPRTRQEDLLRRFLDGLIDDKARFHVEFVKEPDNIDQAVFEVVNFMETTKRPNRRDTKDDSKGKRAYNSANILHEMHSTSDDSDEEVAPDKIARAPARSGKSSKIKSMDATSRNEPNEQLNKESAGSTKTNCNTSEPAQQTQLEELLKKLERHLQEFEAAPRFNQKANKQKPFKGLNARNNRQQFPLSTPQPGATTKGDGQFSKNRTFQCYCCGELGHFARDCPHQPWVTGQMKVAVQPGPQHMNPAQPRYASCFQSQQPQVEMNATPQTKLDASSTCQQLN